MGLGDILGKVGSAIESGSDKLYLDHIGHALDTVGEVTQFNSGASIINNDLIQPALKGMETGYQYGIARPLTTALITDDWGDSFGESWAQSKNISPGQAFVAAFGKKSSEISGALNIDPDIFAGPIVGGLLGDTNRDDFDIRSEQDRQAFTRGGAMLSSGASDAALRWFADPTVLGGKLAFAGKTKAVTRPLGLNKLDTAGQEARLDEVLGPQFGDRLSADKKMKAYGDHYFPPKESATWATPEARDTRRVQFVNDPNFADDIATAEYLAHANSPHELNLRMRVAMMPNNENVGHLAGLYPKAHEEYARLRDVTLPNFKAAMAETGMTLEQALESGKPALITRARAEQEAATVAVQEATAELQRAAGDHLQILLATQAAGTVKNIPRVTTGMKLGKAYAEHKGASWAVYQPSRYSAVRILRSAVTGIPGVIVHDQPGSAVEEITKLFDRAGHGASGRGMGQNTRNVGVSDEVRAFHIQQVSTAAASGSIPELQNAIQAAELAAIEHVGHLIGIEPKVASALYDDFKSARAASRWETLRGRRAGPQVEGATEGTPGVFSGATAQSGLPADHFMTSDGTLQAMPLSVSQLENSTPLVDLDFLTRMMRREKYTLTDPDTATLLEKMRDKGFGNDGYGPLIADSTRWTMEQINRGWKPAQLARLGWPVRAVTDLTLRSMATIGALAHLRLAGESLGNSLAQGRLNYRVRDLATSGQRRLAAKALADISPGQATATTERGGIVAELTAAHNDRGEVNTLIAEARDAITMARENGLGAAEDKAIARLDALRHRAAENAALVAQHTGRDDALTEWARGLEEDQVKYLALSKRPSERIRGEDGRPLKFAGTVTMTKNGVTVQRPDSFSGHYGRMMYDLSSQSNTTRSLANVTTQQLNHMRVVGGETVTMDGVLPAAHEATKREIKLLRETYNAGWERAVNEQIGLDPMMRQLVQNKSNEEILTWMNETPAGAEYVRKMASVPRAQREEWIENARSHVNQYLPDENLKLLALEGRATAKDLRTHNKTVNGDDDSMLPVIHAQSLDLLNDKNPVDQFYSNSIDKIYAKLATAPTDVLAQHPYFASIYRREMQHSFEGLAVDDADMVSEATWAQVERRARHTALRETKRTMYDVANASNLAHTVRFIMPFYGAWADALQTWARIWSNDPSTLAHTLQIWGAPSKAPSVYENADGQKYMAIPLPKAVREKLGLRQNPGMPVHWMRDLVFQGQYWYNPGTGVPVAVPLGMVVRERPDLETLFKPLLPYGAGDSWQDQVLPAGWKKGQSLFSAEDDGDYAKAQFRLFQDVYTDDRLNGTGMTDIEMWDEAKRRTNDLFTVRMAANFSLPFAPNIRSPYQLYIDQWRSIQEQYRKDPNAFGGKTAQDHFIDEWGEDYFVFTLAASKSNVGGISPTVEGFKGFNQYRDLVREMPEMGSLIVGDTGGEYSSAVAQWMQGERIGPGDNTHLRDIRDPKQGIIDAQVNRGWTKFRAIDDATDAAMAERGLTSLRSKGAADIKALRDSMVAKVKEDYPHWAEEFGNFDRGKADRRVGFLEKLVDDPRVIDRPGFRSLAQYLSARQIVVTALAGRTSHNLQAQSNADLLAVFEAITNTLRKDDLDFATLHTRWLSSDDLDTGGVI